MGLLVNCLQTGIALSYPENDWCDKTHANEIYQECIRMANLIISYSKNFGDVLQARMNMAFLHSAYGNIEKAREHAEKLPTRSDMTRQCMYGHIMHDEKDYSAEANCRQLDFHYRLPAILDNIILLGDAYRLMGKYNDALKVFNSVFPLNQRRFKR